MREVATDLPFLGSRKYIQSSQFLDLLGASLPSFGIGECERMKVQFRSFVRSQGVFFMMGDAVDCPQPSASFVLVGGGATTKIGFRETGEPVTRVAAYDEAALAAGMRIDGEQRVALLEQYEGVSFFAALVALNKHLILSFSPPCEGEAWILAQLELESPFAYAASLPEIGCRVRSCIGGKVVKSVIELNGTVAGESVFTKVGME